MPIFASSEGEGQDLVAFGRHSCFAIVVVPLDVCEWVERQPGHLPVAAHDGNQEVPRVSPG
ncbi:MAG: hypothetical protein ACRETL_03990, partial [Gammaproteobacteria bacterium]